MLLSEPAQELKNFTDKFLEGDENPNPMIACMTYLTKQRTEVKWTNSEKFEQEFINNPNSDQCILEVVKNMCPGCSQTKPVTDVISRKMKKHGMLEKMPIYRMDETNESSFLYEIPHTPIQLYFKKEGGKIVEIT